MTTKHRNSLTLLTILVLGLVLTSGCDKKCQPPAAEKFKTITGQKWRLVETTDPDPNFKNLSKSTFLTFEFGIDYKGSVNVVQNNTQYDTPVKTFIYNIDTATNTLRLKYTDGSQVAEDTGTGGQAPLDKAPQNSVVQYSYDLGRELNMVDSKGNSYRFVPFTGIVAPDDTCVF